MLLDIVSEHVENAMRFFSTKMFLLIVLSMVYQAFGT
jgi:hypothetical protein